MKDSFELWKEYEYDYETHSYSKPKKCYALINASEFRYVGNVHETTDIAYYGLFSYDDNSGFHITTDRYRLHNHAEFERGQYRFVSRISSPDWKSLQVENNNWFILPNDEIKFIPGDTQTIDLAEALKSGRKYSR